MTIVTNREIYLNDQHTITCTFRKIIDIGKKLIKIFVDHNSTRFIVRFRGIEIWKIQYSAYFPTI